MAEYKFKVEDIWRLTDGGFNVIRSYYPDAHRKKHFKIHDEKTASTALKKMGDVWLLTNFGAEAKGKNAIQIVQEEESLTFFEAMKYIDANFCGGTLNNSKAAFNKPIVEDSKNTTDSTILEYNKEITKKELSFIGKDVTVKVAERFNLKSVKFYITKSGKKITSTPDYPILCFDQGEWQKVYQPKGDKAYRFFHVGSRPKDFIFGMKQLEADVIILKKAAQTKIHVEGDGGDIKDETLDKLVKEEITKDMPDVIIASGERDGLNIAAAGHTVIWQNSETAVLHYGQYWDIEKLSKNIYNVPDLDATGIKQAYKLALKYIDIKTIWLPEKLRKERDWRGNPCKDATDFFDKIKRAKDIFSKMKSVAYPLKFWKKDSKERWMIDNTSMYQFLHANGYYRLVDLNNKFLYTYIKLKGNIVEKINPEIKGSIKNHVKDFIINYIEDEFLPIGIRNMFFKTRQLDENSLSGIKYSQNLDFQTYGKDFQYMFFKNKAWNITKEGVEEINFKSIKKNVWEEDIKTKCTNVKKHKKPMFEISYSKAYGEYRKTAKNKENYPDIDKYDISFNNDVEKNFIWMKYLINTSRIFWQKGKSITEAEKKEQRLHLINKIYTIGYLAHRHKNPSHNWAVFAIDGKESEAGKSYGGSGKSICYMALEHINKQFYIGGRNPKKLEGEFLYDGVDEFTYNVLVDDSNQYLDFGLFFTPITGKMNINPKGKTQFTLEKEDSPKFAFTSNFGLRNIDPSTERRILYSVFSDYYHKKDQYGHYKDNMDPLKEFGKNLFSDFTEDEWNSFYNFIALAIQTYLKFEKIEPPMKNVHTRNLRSSIGEDVLAWANDYFANGEFLNTFFEKETAFNNCSEKYISKSKRNYFTIRNFKAAVKNYCHYRDWIFNPGDACNDKQGDGRIMKIFNGKNTEHFYIQTDKDAEISVKHEIIDDVFIQPLSDVDDVPF